MKISPYRQLSGMTDWIDHFLNHTHYSQKPSTGSRRVQHHSVMLAKGKTEATPEATSENIFTRIFWPFR